MPFEYEDKDLSILADMLSDPKLKNFGIHIKNWIFKKEIWTTDRSSKNTNKKVRYNSLRDYVSSMRGGAFVHNVMYWVPLQNMPLYLNHRYKYIAIIARWGLTIAK